MCVCWSGRAFIVSHVQKAPMCLVRAETTKGRTGRARIGRSPARHADVNYDDAAASRRTERMSFLYGI